MNSETLSEIFAAIVIVLIWSYYIYKIIALLHNRSIAKQKGEELIYRHRGAFKNVSFEVLGCLLQMFLIFYMLRNRLSYRAYIDFEQADDLRSFIIFFIGLFSVHLIKMIYIFLYFKFPFVLTDKYFIINGSIHKRSKIFYSYLDENMILAKEYNRGKINELLRISMDESKIIQVVRKYSLMKDISLITCQKDENDNNSTGY